MIPCHAGVPGRAAGSSGTALHQGQTLSGAGGMYPAQSTQQEAWGLRDTSGDILLEGY